MKIKDKKLMLIDTILIIFSLYVSLLLRFDFEIYEKYISFFKISIIPVIIIILIFNYIFNLYNNMWQYASIEELLSLVYSITASNIIFILYSYFINYKLIEGNTYRFPFTVHFIFWMLLIFMQGGVRFIYRIKYEKSTVKSSSKSTRVLIIGAGDATSLLVKEISKHFEINYDIVGLIDDDYNKRGKMIRGNKVIGGRKDIPRICKEQGVEEIIFAAPSMNRENKMEIFSICKQTNCQIKTIPGIYEILEGKVNIGKIRDVNIEDLLGREEVKLNTEDIDNFISGKVVMVTGGGGSIGSELCRQLAKYSPEKLVIVDIYENNVYDLQMELNHKYPELNKAVLIASIRDMDKLEDIFNEYEPEVVFHAAAHKHVPLMEANPSETIKNNILGTYNVLKCCDKYKVERFVQISTDKAVNPTNIMGASKRFCEIMVQAFDKVSKTEYVAVRFGNVLGSNGSVIPLFKKQIEHGGPVTVTHPEINRFFMTIPEAAQLVIEAGAMAKGGEIFVLDMGEPVKIADLASDLIKLSGFEPGVDIEINYTGLRPGEKLYEELLIDSELALTDTRNKKIFVEEPQEYNIKFVEDSIEDFKQVLSRDKNSMFEMMEKKVPTYKRKKQ